MKKIFLLDAYALIFRAYYAFIRNPIYNSKGLNTSAILGFTNTLSEVLRNEKPTHIAVVFDPSTPTFRNEIYPEYKANRPPTPEAIKLSVPYIKQILDGFQIPYYEVPGYEADDVIGTLAYKLAPTTFDVFLMTPDKDYLQLIDDKVLLYKPKTKLHDIEIIDLNTFRKIYELNSPKQYIDVLALAGDQADNIPGVPGIGEKTALKLIRQYQSLENLYQNIDQIKGKLKDKLLQNKDLAFLSKKLVTILTDAPIDITADELEYKGIDKDKLIKIFNELEFKTTAQRILNEHSEPTLFGDQNPADIELKLYKTIKDFDVDYRLVQDLEQIKQLNQTLLQQKEFTFDTETSSIDPHQTEIVGISFCFKKHQAFYIPTPKDQHKTLEILNLLKPALQDEKILKIGQNIKFDLIVLKNYGIDVKGPLFDTMIAHYLLAPELKHNMDYLAETYLNYKTIHIDELIGKRGKNQGSMRNLPPEKIKDYACEDSDITFQLKQILEKELFVQGMDKLFNELEMPLVRVLTDMEITGVKLDIDFLKQYRKIIIDKISQIEQKIYELAGEQFNISSTKQLGHILFEKLKIVDKPKLTKTKQYSTSEEELKKHADKHPIIPLILEYRSLKKLLSAYIDSLPKLINPKTGRIHTSFNQTITATGRLSSNNPNLQNIPIRTEEGRQIRKAFIASDENHIIVDADYSQIELRIMAHLSQDPNMIKAFKEGKDIHTETASKIFGVPPEKVTKEMRYKAKTANFAIIYGSSAFGLAQNLGISRKEAKQLIDGYFETYPKVKEYIQKVIEQAREKEYVETIMGRRRYLPDINSHNHVVRANAERNAINTPIQGSAADIIKLAMIKIFERFNQLNLKSKMIIQVHDELVFDVLIDEAEQVKQIIKYEMENAIKLRVPLVVDMGQGKNWYEAH